MTTLSNGRTMRVLAVLDVYSREGMALGQVCPLFFLLSNLLYLASMATTPLIILQSATVGQEKAVSVCFAWVLLKTLP
jgi:hypothetical protein